MSKVKQQWDEFCNIPFPEELVAKEFQGVCVTSIDTFAAGCIHTYIDRGYLDPERRGILEECLDDLDKVMPDLAGPGKAYFMKLYLLGKTVVEEINNAC